MPNAQKLWQDFISSAESGSTRCRAVRQFIGREELLNLYFDLKDRAREEQFKGYYVVNFYGEPGIWKSTLLRQIESRLQAETKDSKEKPPVILRADFDNPALSSAQDVLGLFRAQLLSQVKGAAFPFFDILFLLGCVQGDLVVGIKASVAHTIHIRRILLVNREVFIRNLFDARPAESLDHVPQHPDPFLRVVLPGVVPKTVCPA